MKYEVVFTERTFLRVIVEAQSETEARNIVNSGEFNEDDVHVVDIDSFKIISVDPYSDVYSS